MIINIDENSTRFKRNFTIDKYGFVSMEYKFAKALYSCLFLAFDDSYASEYSYTSKNDGRIFIKEGFFEDNFKDVFNKIRDRHNAIKKYYEDRTRGIFYTNKKNL